MNIRYAVTRLVDEIVNSVNQENQIKLDAYNTAVSQVRRERKLMDEGEIDRADIEEPEPPKVVKVKNVSRIVDEITEQLEALLDSEKAVAVKGVEVEQAPKAPEPQPQEGTVQGSGEAQDASGGTQGVNAEQNPSSADDSPRGESRRGDIGNRANVAGTPVARNPRK